MNQDLLEKAIAFSAILPSGQKRVLGAICTHSYPISAKELEEELSLTRPSVNFSLKQLLKRNFIIRVKENIFLYKPNQERIEELKARYVEKNLT
jgi:predicted transcriptional regulator